MFELLEDYYMSGYCTVCCEITRDGDVEPDAEGYYCPQCGGDTVMGFEMAVIAGEVDLDNFLEE